MGVIKEYDVIVSGAGPGGLTCALYLARAGKKVLLLEKEKFPRDKVCADNKTWLSLDIVRELGLWGEFMKLPKAEIRGLLVSSPAGYEIYTPLLEKDVKEKGPWYNVRRKPFDTLLAEAARREKNIQFWEGARVTEPLWKGRRMVGVGYRRADGHMGEACAQVVVGADGSASPIAMAAGLNPHLKGRYAVNGRAYYSGVKGVGDRCELHYLKGVCPGYFWIFPVEDAVCNVGIGMREEDAARMGMTLEEKLEQVISSERFRHRFVHAKRKGMFGQAGLSVLGHRRPCSGEGFALVGDAATMALPFSGEGVGPAMRSGKMAAQAIAQCLEIGDTSAKSLGRYDGEIWKVVGPEAAGLRWLEFLLLNEPIFDEVVRRGARNADLVEISSRMQRDYSVSRELVSPANLLKLLLA